MRILHVVENLAPGEGGPTLTAIETVRALAARGHEARIFAMDWDRGGRRDVPLDRPVEEGGAEVRYFAHRFGRVWPVSLAMARALGEEVPRCDAVHVHSLYLFHDWAAARACRAAGVPYLLRPHGTLDPWLARRRPWKRRLAEWGFQNRVTDGAAALHFTTEEEMRLAEPWSRGRPGVVVPNGLDVAALAAPADPEAFFAAVPEARGRRVLLFLGRLHAKKGLDILIPAFAELAAARPELHLVVAGPDFGEAGSVRRTAAALGVGERVSLPGPLEGAAKRAAFAAAELFVLPSYTENFGMAVVEALAAGCPVAISDAVQIWREVETAAAVFAAEPAALVRALAEVLDDPARRAALAHAAPGAAAQFDWAQVAPRLEAVYAEMAGRADAARRAA
jgi:glycosyltransferase involved in cell wall biosynthesis